MNEELLYRWLTAERQGRDTEAEEVLFEVFRAFPLALPSAGFVAVGVSTNRAGASNPAAASSAASCLRARWR